MSQDWTEKYRPKSLRDVLGNPKAVAELQAWAESWTKGTPKYRAAVLIGSPGIGKTTSAEALANDMGWGLMEMNASDQRNADAIRSVALRGANYNTFTSEGSYLDASEGGMKLIVLDEADNLFGNADRGGAGAIGQLIKETQQPVLLIVNDFYGLSKKSSVIKTNTVQITFAKAPKVTMCKALKRIANQENVEITDEAVARIAENANGDMRAAVRDLQAMCLGKTTVDAGNVAEISQRNNTKSMYDLIGAIFRKSDVAVSRAILRDLNEEPSTVLEWIDENMPYEYTDRGDLIRGYEKLSRADIFLGRAKRRQYYGMWSYANDMMTAGVCTARATNRVTYSKFRFPSHLTYMSRTKGIRETKKAVCQKLADYIHTSTKRVSTDVLPPLRLMLKDDAELRAALLVDADLEPEELAFLLSVKADSKAVTDAAALAEQMKAERRAQAKPKPAADNTFERFTVPVKPVKEKAPETVTTPAKPKGQRSLFDF